MADRPGSWRAALRALGWCASSVAGMVRHAVADLAQRTRPFKWTDADINLFVHGHTPDGIDRVRGPEADRRFMYLPLPSLEHRQGRGIHVGMIRRVLVVGPPGAIREIQWIRRVLSGRELFAERQKDPVGVLTLIPTTDATVRAYTRPSAVWSTTTPVLLPGHDDGASAKTERLLRKSLTQAGLPTELVGAAQLEWRVVGFRPGVDLSHRYRRPESPHTSPRYHVQVRWPEPVPGPLAVGAGRYRGLGVFAAEAGE